MAANAFVLLLMLVLSLPIPSKSMSKKAWWLAVMAVVAGRQSAIAGPAGESAIPEVTLVAAGDVLLDRTPGKKIARYGVDYPFTKVVGILAKADIAFANLECPLSEAGGKVNKPFSFRARPAGAQGLARAGFDILSLANNHSMDCRRDGLVETMEHLAGAGIHWCGAGKDRAAAESPTIIEANGLRVAFLAFCDFLPEGVFLNDEKPGIALASVESVRRAVADARRRADVVVVSFHWGVERSPYRTARQEELARAAVTAGACLVLGHHAHVLQRVEYVRPHALVAYSLGNFVFDGLTAPEQESVLLRCRLTREGVVGAEAIPLRIQECRPAPVSGPAGAAVLRKLGLPGAGLRAARPV